MIEGGPNISLSRTGIKNIVNNWVNGMLGLSNSFKRLDGSEGTYLRELIDSPDVQLQVGLDCILKLHLLSIVVLQQQSSVLIYEKYNLIMTAFYVQLDLNNAYFAS
jgi:hypothetical protein